MRRPLALIFALALIATACGDDDSGDGTAQAPDTTATATTAAATTAATTAASTTAAPTTTVAPTTTAPPTTADPTAARVAAAMAFEGEYGGEWQNETFGTTGGFMATVEVDETVATAVVTIDIDGGVFGGPDPDPFVFEVDLTQDPPYTFTTDLLGEATLDVAEDGTVRLDAPMPPNLGASFLVEGSVLGDIRYEVNDGAGTVFAEGVLALGG